MRILITTALATIFAGLAARQATAQIIGIDPRSAEGRRHIEELQREAREEKIRYEKSTVVKATTLPKPSAEEIETDIRIREEQKEKVVQWVTYLLKLAQDRKRTKSLSPEERAKDISELKELLRRLNTGDPPIAQGGPGCSQPGPYKRLENTPSRRSDNTSPPLHCETTLAVTQ